LFEYRWFPPLDRLYAAKRPVDAQRPMFQGDVYDHVITYRFPYEPDDRIATPRQRRGPVMVLGHPCEISEGEKGAELPWRTVCPVAADNGRLTLDGEGDYNAFALPDLHGDGATWYADFRFVSVVHVDWLLADNRIVSLSEAGWLALQRRLVHFLSRVIVHWDDLIAVGADLHPGDMGNADPDQG
jgi:hypothetical protein